MDDATNTGLRLVLHPLIEQVAALLREVDDLRAENAALRSGGVPIYMADLADVDGPLYPQRRWAHIPNPPGEAWGQVLDYALENGLSPEEHAARAALIPGIVPEVQTALAEADEARHRALRALVSQGSPALVVCRGRVPE